MYKDSIWAKKLIEEQREDGGWSYFHSLSEPKKYPHTTEQALRRLEILGYTIEDKPIKKAVDYLEKCLLREWDIPDYKEKHRHWEDFVDLMLATWILRFDETNTHALKIRDKWITITQYTFKSGKYNLDDFIVICKEVFGFYEKKPLISAMSRFYNLSLLANQLDLKTENVFFDYVLNNEGGVYYVNTSKLLDTPNEFAHKNASKYLGAVEMLMKYDRQKHKLQFVKDWLLDNQIEEGKWDLGKKVKDGIYFPLSNDWRKNENRIKDCTYRVNRILKEL
ncbi:MAG: hypothetical protein RBQ64_05820 [Candidatus Izemoplasmatales bacterium]|jgi:hypothetical protein|nr:hypothetical protein [Candidatus Izemoplasmatales bacterium]